MHYDVFAGYSARARSTSRGLRLVLVIASIATCTLASAQIVSQADLSMLSDFGVSDIVAPTSLTGPVAGIQQDGGSGNLAYVEQSGGNSLAQVWQQGDNNIAKVVQDGRENEIRLWQEGSGHSANLVQIGSFNQIAASQYGVDSVLDGRQEGVGNRAAVVLMDESRLSFSQIGNYNTIEETMPVRTTMQITQTGNGMDARLTGN